MKIAAGEWRSMSSVLKKAWKDRCSGINQLPVHGVFRDVPPMLVSNLNHHVLQSLTYEFDRFSSFIRQTLKTKPRVADNIKCKTFGKERFDLGEKICQSFYFNHLLEMTILGDWNGLSRLKDREIAQRSRMTRVLHEVSKRRLIELFCLTGVCPFVVDDGSSSVSYCSGGKASLQELASDREGVGLVEDEDADGSFRIIVGMGERVIIKGPQFMEGGTWDYSACYNDRYRMIQFDPIRIRLLKSGNSFLVMNRFILAKDEDNNVRLI